MPRAGLSRQSVVGAAAGLLDQRPGEELSIAALAEHLGVRPPSLYKHVEGAEGLRRGIMLRAKADLTDVFRAAAVGRARRDAVHSIAVAYRQWAKEHPGQYPLVMRPPVPGDGEDEDASAALVDVLYAVLSGYRLEGESLVDAVRFMRSSLHGFVDLETTGAFQLSRDLDASYARLVTSITAALETWEAE